MESRPDRIADMPSLLGMVIMVVGLGAVMWELTAGSPEAGDILARVGVILAGAVLVEVTDRYRKQPVSTMSK